MYGFFGTYGEKINWDFTELSNDLLSRNYVFDNFAIEQKTFPKFLQDKVWAENSDYFYAIEGLVFEPHNLAEIPTLYETYGETFFSRFRGSFLGVFYDKKQDILLIYNDQVGEKMLFYTQTDVAFYFASDFYVLVNSLGLKNETLNERFLWSILTYGYSPVTDTLLENVKRLGAGEYLRLHAGDVEKKRYHQFCFNAKQLSEKETLENIDKYFRQAVERVLEKDRQYGLQHTMSLSAGLDSRMSVCVARSLTTEPIDVVTYSESKFYDETIPREIAQAWNLNLHFSKLDGGNYLSHIDDSVKCINGLVQYSGPAQVRVGANMLDRNKFGVLLTGMYGDAALNARHPHETSYYLGEGALSDKYLSHLVPFFPDFEQIYPNNETYYLYVRGFCCANFGTPLVIQYVGESYSPFYDVDFLEFCCTIPPEMRYGYNLYDKWILEYYPQAAKWLHNGTRKIGSYPKQITLFGRTIEMKELPKRLIWYLCKNLKIHDFYRAESGKSMNPLDSWFETNANLRKILDDYFNENIERITSAEMKKAAIKLYKNGVMMEKLQVITLLSAIKLLRE